MKFRIFPIQDLCGRPRPEAHFSFVCRDLFIETQHQHQQQPSSLCLRRKWQRSRQLGNLHVKFTDKNREERILLLQIIHICRKQTWNFRIFPILEWYFRHFVGQECPGEVGECFEKLDLIPLKALFVQNSVWRVFVYYSGGLI